MEPINKVQCKECLYEKDGFCSKKKVRGNFIKIDLGKKRVCDIYVVDPIRSAEHFTRGLSAKTRAIRAAKRNAQFIEFMKQKASEIDNDKEIVK